MICRSASEAATRWPPCLPVHPTHGLAPAPFSVPEPGTVEASVALPLATLADHGPVGDHNTGPQGQEASSHLHPDLVVARNEARQAVAWMGVQGDQT